MSAIDSKFVSAEADGLARWLLYECSAIDSAKIELTSCDKFKTQVVWFLNPLSKRDQLK